MSDVLKGNFQVKKTVEPNTHEQDVIGEFEREALKRLGGSIAFVSKKQFLFGVGEVEEKS